MWRRPCVFWRRHFRTRLGGRWVNVELTVRRWIMSDHGWSTASTRPKLRFTLIHAHTQLCLTYKDGVANKGSGLQSLDSSTECQSTETHLLIPQNRWKSSANLNLAEWKTTSMAPYIRLCAQGFCPVSQFTSSQPWSLSLQYSL